MADPPLTFAVLAQKRRELCARIEARRRRQRWWLNQTDEALERSRILLDQSRRLLAAPVRKAPDTTLRDGSG
jgi:hypothetical protein